MAYTAWSVVAGEKPTAAKWNILGDNDAAFHDGSGLGDNSIQQRHMGGQQWFWHLRYQFPYQEMTGTFSHTIDNLPFKPKALIAQGDSTSEGEISQGQAAEQNGVIEQRGYATRVGAGEDSGEFIGKTLSSSGGTVMEVTANSFNNDGVTFSVQVNVNTSTSRFFRLSFLFFG